MGFYLNAHPSHTEMQHRHWAEILEYPHCFVWVTNIIIPHLQQYYCVGCPLHAILGSFCTRAVASLSLPDGQDKNISSIFPHFPVCSLIFPQSFFIFFLILVFRVGGLPTREGPGYATVLY